MVSSITDQVLHVAWSFLTVAAFVVLDRHVPGFFAGAVAGLVLALPRELIDQRPPGKRLPIFPIGANKTIDLSMFALGGALAGIVT